jgi:hypothetical protein
VPQIRHLHLQGDRHRHLQRHDRIWRVRWDKGRHSASFGTRAEASAFAVEVHANGFRDPRKANRTLGGLTFRQAAEQYLATLSVSSRTIGGYRGHLENHVNPVIGHLRVAEISTPDLARLFSRLTDKPATASQVKACIVHPVFAWAIMHEHRVRANPADGLRQSRTRGTCSWCWPAPGSAGRRHAC